MRDLPTLLRNDRAASAAEFALVLPILLLFLLGIVDAGRFIWDYNRAEKATQMGVRYAVATNPVAPGLSTYSFASAGVPAGNSVPTSSAGGTVWFASATCNNTTCNPTTSPCSGSSGICGGIGYNSTAFTNIVDRMRVFYPGITAANVEIEYRNLGLGYAGAPDYEDPDNPGTTIYNSDVAPLVTVRLKNLTFRPITLLLFKQASFNMPDFAAALTFEDGSGTVSN
jgi:hypothetical protein